jgi:two-component system alkaline phosphatase synthesis response regulator PhoP
LFRGLTDNNSLILNKRPHSITPVQPAKKEKMETRKKILIVDDESDILEFLSYNFAKKGFQVYVAGNGKKGFLRAKQIKPDIIVSDLLMDEVDGIEFCTMIRNDEELKETPFIILSALNDDYKVLYAMSSGANEYATKPIRFPYLLSIVKELIREGSIVAA